MIRAQVIIRPRASIFDPQGDAVQRAIEHLGVSTVKQAHVGKFIELEVDADNLAQTRTELETICRDLLSNPVIEDYVLTLDGSKEKAKKPAAAKPVAKKVVKKAVAKVKPAAPKTAKKIKLTKAEKKAAKKAAKKAKKTKKK